MVKAWKLRRDGLLPRSQLRLTDLSPEFLKFGDERTFQMVESIEGADGLSFICPKCFSANNRQRPGVHGIICWTPRVPKTVSPAPGRWNILGTGFADLTLRAGSSSVLLMSGCKAHFHITKGAIIPCAPDKY